MTECPTGCLLDLSEPSEVDINLYDENENFDKENSIPVIDSIELARSDDSDRRNSVTICKSLDIDDRIFNDVTDKTLTNNTCILDPHNLPSPDDMWLEKETFDFDLVLSPPESKKDELQDEEEIFFGPMGFTERCVAAVVARQTPVKPMSPLNPQQLAEVIKEAHGVSCLFTNMKSGGSSSDDGKSPQKKLISTRLFSKSPRHTKNRTFSIEKDVENISPPEANNHVRQDTFTKETEVTKLAEQVIKRRSIKAPVRDLSATRSSTLNKTKEENSSNKPGLKPKFSRLPKSRSATNLAKTESQESLVDNESTRQRYKSGDSEASESSITSDTSDISLSRLSSCRKSFTSNIKAPTSTGKRMQAPMIKQSLTTLNKVGSSKLTVKNLSQQQGPIKLKHTRTNSNSSMDSVSSQTSNVSNSSFMSQSSNIGKPIIKSNITAPAIKGTIKAPLGKFQSKMMKPVIQKKVPPSRPETRKSLNGPMKVPQAIKPSTSNINKSFVDRKTTKSDNTPVKQEKSVKPKRLSTAMGTLGKSSSVSSTGSSGSITDGTPTSSRKRHSLLPTPSKSRPSSSGSIPASPLSYRSSNSSITSISSRLGASLSDATDSPVFELDNNKKAPARRLVKESPSVMKPKKNLVQNTPDIPVTKPSRWSPIVRRKVDLQEQAIQCTKRAAKN
ncbi:G2 and S phase-expressed protein 1 isoform X1 [Patella vulgata]|uniref:G2 and S phase-expressed protein 1 isoform X1 n=1 Tax=Patella vulgata TaxID=6465 RepID=UPI0024A8DFF7|nr:G2 and S phase-expressed protein 1 isoform X1 [Patella vulgata]XP_050413308.2 G2 and S phase-expressed protein 1 isoform X1 [Patella vulgata]